MCSIVGRMIGVCLSIIDMVKFRNIECMIVLYVLFCMIGLCMS